MSTPARRFEPSDFLNRELSWIEFDRRVLDAARDRAAPLLERVKFLAISGTNLDEFFMVRVAGLKGQAAANVDDRGADGLSPTAQLREISRRAHELVDRQYALFREELVPALRAAHIELVRPASFTDGDRAEVAREFRDRIFPVLTPLAVDPGHPFPHLRNLTLNLAVRFLSRRGASFGVVQVPRVLGRFVPLPAENGTLRLAWLEDVIALHVNQLFPGNEIELCAAFRLTRNFDLHVDEEEAEDLLTTIEKEVRRRDRGNAVRVELDADADEDLNQRIVRALRLGDDDVYRIRGPLDLGDLRGIESLYPTVTTGGENLKDEPFVPARPPNLREAAQILPAIARGDVLLHHPYESFDPVVEFVEEAADDPDVLAIKQTLYRTSGDSPIVQALARAAGNRKQVTAIVEIKARFDEENNIAWARALESAGVHVVYGLLGFKTHCKMSLVVRREGSGIRRYLHLSTGNYNPATARAYTDLSFFTAREPLCADASALFNVLTGNTSANGWRAFAVAPFGLQERVLALIGELELAARAGKEARLTAKMNALVDADVIRGLYRAAQAGAKIDLLVRGICCLRPGVPGLSDNIRVRSVVDRFLEHSRILHVVTGEREQVWLASADWMPRNFQRRIEVMFPVDDPALKRRIVDEILGTMASPSAVSEELSASGEYHHVPAEGGVRPQTRFLEIARESARAPRVAVAAPLPAGPVRARG